MSRWLVSPCVACVAGAALWPFAAGARGPALPVLRAAAIDPAVYAALAAAPDGQANFVLYFGEPPDLSGADAIADWNARGRYVAGRLQASAAASQAPVLDKLDRRAVSGRITGHRSLWIANAIVVRGDRAAAEALAQELGVVAILPELKVAPLPAGNATPPLPALAPDAVEWGVQKIGAPAVWAAPFRFVTHNAACGRSQIVGHGYPRILTDHF